MHLTVSFWETHRDRLTDLLVLACFPAMLLLAKPTLGQETDVALKEEQAIREAVVLAAPSVVKIQTVGGLDRVGAVLTGTGPTTGVVTSEDGYIVTSSFNFASKPASILVTLDDGRRLPAEIVSTDHLKQLTLLKIDAKGLTVPTFVPPKELIVGQWSIALGRTYDQPLPNVSVGIVSALKRVWGKAIQTDAKISPMNYGGPIIDIRGRVQGILVPLSPQGNELTSGVQWYDSGIGFAIPYSDIRDVLDRMKSGEDLKPGKIGITFKSSGLDESSLVIDQVRVASPAEKAGLKTGDKIISVDGQKTRRQSDVKHVIGRKYAKDMLKMAVKRGDQDVKTEMKLVAELLAYESGFLGILPGRGIDQNEDQSGLPVRYVFKDTPAEQAGLKRGDRILKIGDAEVTDAASLKNELKRLLPGTKVTISYSRDEKTQNAEVELSGVSTTTPSDLPSTAIPPGNLDPKAEGGLQLGRFSEQLPEYKQSLWAYVPEDYNPDFEYGLLVWLHPGGDTMESELLKRWKSHASQRGFIIVAPKAKNISGWTPGEAEFINDCVAWIRERYNVAEHRIVAHTHDSGANITASVAFKERETYSGVILSSAPFRTRPPENHPDFPFQFCLVYGEKSNRLEQYKRIGTGLNSMKFPTTVITIPDAEDDYPNADLIKRLASWVDSIDRL